MGHRRLRTPKMVVIGYAVKTLVVVIDGRGLVRGPLSQRQRPGERERFPTIPSRDRLAFAQDRMDLDIFRRVDRRPSDKEISSATVAAEGAVEGRQPSTTALNSAGRHPSYA